jgi:hypothetical protein
MEWKCKACGTELSEGNYNSNLDVVCPTCSTCYEPVWAGFSEPILRELPENKKGTHTGKVSTIKNIIPEKNN